MYYVLRVDDEGVNGLRYAGMSKQLADVSLDIQILELTRCSYDVDESEPGVYRVTTTVRGVTRYYGHLVLVKSVGREKE